METIQHYDVLCARLRASTQHRLIGVEGFCSSGKTKLADNLARDLPARVIHLDDFATPRDNPPPYPDGLNVEGLRAALTERGSEHRHIVEGICLREVLRRCGTTAGLFIYAKRQGSNGLWYDGLHLEDHEHGSGIPGNEQEPHASDFAYHSAERPHERADIIYLRVEDD